MSDPSHVSVNQVNSVATVRRVVRFQTTPCSLAPREHHFIREDAQQVNYKLETSSDPTERTLRYTGEIELDGLAPGATGKLTIFGTQYDVVVRAELQTDTTLLSWYRERLYMLGYITVEELELGDVKIPAAGAVAPPPASPPPAAGGAAPAAATPTAAGAGPATPADGPALHGLLTQDFLEGLLAFQASHKIPLDEDLSSDSDSIKRTRVALDLEAGT